MSINKISSDLSFEIFKYLNIQDLDNLHKINKCFNFDIEKYSKTFFKNSWSYILNEKTCIHCKNLCSENNLCEDCLCDTCWKCFKKVGNEYLFVENFKSNNEIYPIFACINGCTFTCNKCNKTFSENLISIDTNKCKNYCNHCNT